MFLSIRSPMIMSVLTVGVVLAIGVLSPSVSQAAKKKPADIKTAESGDRSLAAVEKNHDGRKRVALVIGNSNYAASPLKNPVNDARAMAATLRRLGFEVEEKTNLGYITLNEAVENFGNRMKTGGVGLFYYAGHGMQVQGNNYLVPVDAKISTENEVRYKAVDAGLVLAKMESAKSDVNIVVLDACRDNPFGRSFRSASRGLANMEAPTGTIIAYATAPGKTAADGDGKNGVYTEALIRALDTPGLKVEDVFKQVRKLVLDKTAKAQVPWESSSLVGDFHFIQPSSMTGLQPTPVQPSPVQPEPVAAVPVVEASNNDVYSDPQTGLMWARNGNIAGKQMNWNDAIIWAKNLNYGGYSDWRLPTKNELEAFVKRSGTQSSEYFNSNGFNYVKPDYYWSFSTYSFNSANAWLIHMNSGGMVYNSKVDKYYVWPVRSGQ